MGGWIGVIYNPLILTIDPNFLGHPSSWFFGEKNINIIFVEAWKMFVSQPQNIPVPRKYVVFGGWWQWPFFYFSAKPNDPTVKLPWSYPCLLVLGSHIIGFQGIAIDAYVTWVRMGRCWVSIGYYHENLRRSPPMPPPPRKNYVRPH